MGDVEEQRRRWFEDAVGVKGIATVLIVKDKALVLTQLSLDDVGACSGSS